MKKNHDYRLPLMKECIRLENVPATINRIHEIKCEAGHIVTADLRIDNLRPVLYICYDVGDQSVIYGGGIFRISETQRETLNAIRSAFVDYVQSCRII